MSDQSAGPGWWQATDGKWYAPEQDPRKPIATPEAKRRVLSIFMADQKYRKPFEKGSMAAMNLLGGTWNEYAEVVLSLMIADTLLNIEQRLVDIEQRLSGTDPDS